MMDVMRGAPEVMDMSDKPMILYTFAHGLIANEDGSRAGFGHGDLEFVVPQGGSGAPAHALVLANGSGVVETPALPEIVASPVIVLGIDVMPTGDASRMTILIGEAVPYQLFVETTGEAYRVGAAVNTQRGWLEIVSESTIPRNKWSKLTLLGRDGDLVLFVGGKVVARRVLGEMDVRTPTGDGWFKVNAVVPKFVGSLGNLTVDDYAEPALMTAAEAARVDGVGEIPSKYLDLGGAKSFLKQPTANEEKIAGGLGRKFAGGAIFWHPKTGAHEVHGVLWGRYLELDGPEGPLGFPTSDETHAATQGARRSRFQRGAIYWSAGTGAHEVCGEIFLRYLGLGEDGSVLGLPVNGESPVTGGSVSNFKGGRLYWSSGTGAFWVRGAILERYLALGGPAALGFPLTDESDVLNKKGKPSGGKLSRFEGCTIFWSPTTGARAVQGAILARYEVLGGPLGELGFPLTDETAFKSTSVRYNDFQHGVIAWKPGKSALEFTSLTLKLGLVSTGKIKDRLNTDHTAELVTYHWVKIDGDTLVDGLRLPGGHAGPSYDIARTYKIDEIHASTRIWLKINAVDYDPVTDNDFLASREVTFDLANFFGQFDGSPPGHYVDMPATAKGGDAYSLDSVRFTYSLSPTLTVDPKKPFRAQFWWNCRNPSTPELTVEQYASTFRDVSNLSDGLDKLRHPFEWLYYKYAYRTLADGGNCFGMALEAIFARKNLSVFAEPIYAVKTTKNGKPNVKPISNVEPGFIKMINHKHGYQIGASAIRWIVTRFLNWDAFQPLDVYAKIKQRLKSGDVPVLCMAKIGGSGHAVMPYECKDGAGTKQDPHIIYVADPNVPYGDDNTKGASYLKIFADNTFEFVALREVGYASDKPAKGLLPTTVLLEIPFHRLADPPRTPFWEIVAALMLGGCLLVFGDAVEEQVASGGKKLYEGSGSQRRVVKNAIPSAMPVPAIDTSDIAGRVLVCQEALPADLTTTVRGTATGRYQRLLASARRVIELDAPTQKGEVDELCAESLRDRGARLTLKTSAPKKRVVFTYGASLANHQGPQRRLIVDMQVASAEPAMLTVGPDERGVLVRPSGPASKVLVTCESYVQGAWVKSQVDCGLVLAGQSIRVRPLSWTKAGCQFAIEHFVSIDGRSVAREIVQGIEPI